MQSLKAIPVFSPSLAKLADWMSRLSNNNAQGEYYLTDVIAMAVSDGLVVATEQPHDPMEVQGAERPQAAWPNWSVTTNCEKVAA